MFYFAFVHDFLSHMVFSLQFGCTVLCCATASGKSRISVQQLWRVLGTGSVPVPDRSCRCWKHKHWLSFKVSCRSGARPDMDAMKVKDIVAECSSTAYFNFCGHAQNNTKQKENNSFKNFLYNSVVLGYDEWMDELTFVLDLNAEWIPVCIDRIQITEHSVFKVPENKILYCRFLRHMYSPQPSNCQMTCNSTQIHYKCSEAAETVFVFPAVIVFHKLNLDTGMVLSAGVIIYTTHNWLYMWLHAVILFWFFL